MKELLINLLNFFGLAWWIEIVTATPSCTYYFGPFLTEKEARTSKDGYFEDLESEGARGIHFAILRCKPPELTVEEMEEEDLGKKTEFLASPPALPQVEFFI